jgi:predicted enzyme related to lactoylglutathione lyase
MDVKDLGRMAIVADPTGAVIGLWEPKPQQGAQPESSRMFCWSELVTTDLDTSKSFYGSVFGWDAEEHHSSDRLPDYTEWKIEGRPVGSLLYRQPEMPADVQPNWIMYFAVDDTDATVSRARELGGSVLVDPIETATGRRAVLADSEGTIFNVIKLKH